MAIKYWDIRTKMCIRDREYTDDCQLVEAIGRRVYLAGGDYANIKLTTPEDQIVAEALLEYAGE